MTTATDIPADAPPDLTPVRHLFDQAHPYGIVQPAESDDPDYLIRVLWADAPESTLEWPDELEVITH